MPSRTALLLAVLPLLILAGCDRSATEPEHGEPDQVELFNYDTGVVFANTQGSGSGRSWAGTFPNIGVGQSLEVGVRFRDEDGDVIPLGGEYSAGASLASGSASGILTITPHGDHLDIGGVAAGTVQIRISLMHGNHSDWNSPPIAVTVSP